MIKQLVH